MKNIDKKTIEDINVTAWATDIFLKSIGDKSYKTDKFILGAKYIVNNPSDFMIKRIVRLVNYYEDLAIFDKSFINNGYFDFVHKHWNDDFDMECQLKDMHIDLLPEEIKK